jgi:hypothetical protein
MALVRHGTGPHAESLRSAQRRATTGVTDALEAQRSARGGLFTGIAATAGAWARRPSQLLSLSPLQTHAGPSSTTGLDSCVHVLSQWWSSLPMNTSTRSLMLFSDDSKFIRSLRSAVIDNKYFEARVMRLPSNSRISSSACPSVLVCLVCFCCAGMRF